ncbi:MAG: PAS domain-containing protein [Polyangiaceae bacterium]
MTPTVGSPMNVQAKDVSRSCLWSEALMSLEFLASVIDHLAHPIFVKDADFRFVLLNRAFEEMLGRPRAEMFGKTDFDFFPKDEAEFFRQKDVELFEDGRIVMIDEETLTDSSGAKHVLTTTKVPLRGDDGKVVFLVGIIHDITRLKAAEDALRQANEELEHRVMERTAALAEAQDELVRKERLAVLGRLAGGLAHQIRNPLGSIRNAAHVLGARLGKGNDPEIERSLGIIFDEIERANQHVTDLLDYARVRPPTAKPTLVGYVVAQAIGALNGVDNVRTELEVPDVFVSIDAGQVQSAVYNLFRNAVEAMPDGGTLRVVAREVDGRVRVVVSDTGKGIPDDVRDRLFEPLVTTKPLGLGLGLSTARALIENQGGTIRALPSRGVGARFEIDLPAALVR